MKVGQIFYWCGWGSIIVGIALIILAFVSPAETPELAVMVFGRTIGAFLMGGAWLYIGSRKIARAKLGQNTPSKSEVIKYCQEQTETLSCPTCVFFNSEAAQQGQPWCDAPKPPDIEKNYCHTFTAK